jgi:hypothetical protein
VIEEIQVSFGIITMGFFDWLKARLLQILPLNLIRNGEGMMMRKKKRLKN